MTANNFVTLQLDAEEESGQPFASEEDRLAMARVLHDYKTAYESEYETTGSIDLETLYNQLGTVFKPESEAPADDLLQAAMMAQVRIPQRPV
jgi:hypothetical protein